MFELDFISTADHSCRNQGGSTLSDQGKEDIGVHIMPIMNYEILRQNLKLFKVKILSQTVHLRSWLILKCVSEHKSWCCVYQNPIFPVKLVICILSSSATTGGHNPGSWWFQMLHRQQTVTLQSALPPTESLLWLCSTFYRKHCNFQ